MFFLIRRERLGEAAAAKPCKGAGAANIQGIATNFHSNYDRENDYAGTLNSKQSPESRAAKHMQPPLLRSNG